jgi:hypothetical protein
VADAHLTATPEARPQGGHTRSHRVAAFRSGAKPPHLPQANDVDAECEEGEMEFGATPGAEPTGSASSIEEQAGPHE